MTTSEEGLHLTLGDEPPRGVADRTPVCPIWVKHTIALTGVVLIGFAVLLPALVHGGSIGPFDILSQYGVLSQPGVSIHNPISTDQIVQMIPWTNLAWTQVHSGHLPLWNPYSGLGLPLAFNWQSAPFSVQALLGYLAPLRFAFTVQIFATLAIAGSGAYALCRVLGLNIWGCTFAAIGFELSGPIVAWLGWPVASVAAWAGWLFAAALLVVRGRRRGLAIAFFSIVLAASIYSGQLDMLVTLLTLLVLFLGTYLALRTRPLGGVGPIRRPSFDLAIAFVAGFALAAPLVLPGFQLATNSVRVAHGATDPGLPLINLVNVIFQGYDGSPIGGEHWFGIAFPAYPEYTAYVGLIVVVLAVIAGVLRRRRSEVKAFVSLVVFAAAFAFAPLVIGVAEALPMGSSVRWHRALIVMVFAIVILAGMGMDVLVRAPSRKAMIRLLGAGFVAAVLLLLGLWLGGRSHLNSVDEGVRSQSFLWPAIECGVGLFVVALLAQTRRRGRPAKRGLALLQANRSRVAASALLVCEVVFLISVGAPLASSSSKSFPSTSAVTALQKSVSGSLLGGGTSACPGYGAPPYVGIDPEANDAYGISEFAIYDPLLPKSYERSWLGATGKNPNGESQFPNHSVFCPAITSVELGRLYGIAYVLEPAGRPGPPGSVFDRAIGRERLYRIPGAARATITPMTSSGRYPPDDAAGTPVNVSNPDPATWKMETNASSPQALRIRLTSAPGWHATIDGRPLPLRPFAGVMLQAAIPPGHHVVELHYWPGAFTFGIVLAALSAAFLLALVIVERYRPGILDRDPRRRRTSQVRRQRHAVTSGEV